MRLRKLAMLAIALTFVLQGCATFKGAKEGFKEDWKAVGKIDDWMRENMW